MVFSSCSLIQPPDTVPSYIRVQSYSDTAYNGQGTSSSNVTDIWVDANSDFMGIYQIPVSVPILKTGPTTISLQAVVQEDGVVSNLLPYPFYTIYKTTVDLKPGVLDTIKPSFTYNTSITNFALTGGDFEGQTDPLKPTSENTANVFETPVKDSVFGGLKSYEVDFSANHESFYVTTSNGLTPPSSFVVWLEMNYKTDVPMDVGILSFQTSTSNNPSQEFVSGVNPTHTWKKVYINLGPALQYYNQNPYFQVYFQANASGNAHILIDNLKILYLE